MKNFDESCIYELMFTNPSKETIVNVVKEKYSPTCRLYFSAMDGSKVDQLLVLRMLIRQFADKLNVSVEEAVNGILKEFGMEAVRKEE